MSAAVTETGLMSLNLAHILFAPPETKPLDLSTFTWSPTTRTYGSWTWLGDHSFDNLPEYDSDGGDATTLRTMDRMAAKTVYEPETQTVSLHMVGLTKDLLSTLYPDAKDDGAGNLALGNKGAIERAMMWIIDDGTEIGGFHHGHVSLKAGNITPASDAFFELDIACSLLNSDINGGGTTTVLKRVKYAAASAAEGEE